MDPAGDQSVAARKSPLASPDATSRTDSLPIGLPHHRRTEIAGAQSMEPPPCRTVRTIRQPNPPPFTELLR